MKQIILYFENLEERERKTLILGLFSVIIVVGIFFITIPNIENLLKTEKMVKKEIENYNELINLASKYISSNRNYKEKELSLGQIEKLSTSSGLKKNIISLKPVEGGIEVSFENVNWNNLVNFITLLKKQSYKIISFHMDKPTKKKVNVRLVIMGQ